MEPGRSKTPFSLVSMVARLLVSSPPEIGGHQDKEQRW
jgi:hypothetical protein